MGKPYYILALIVAFSYPLHCAVAAEPFEQTKLETKFQSPPADAKPWTWWHWVDGNVTREGITSDLEAMKRAGIGGALVFNVALGLPDGPARFMDKQWLALLDHAAAECDRLGLKLGIHNCDGWSQSGGPWITPERSMKELVWSSVEVHGPQKFSGELPRPPLPHDNEYVKGFYRDIAVIAYPTPAGTRVNGPDSGVIVSGNLPEKKLKSLVDGTPRTTVSFPLRSGGKPTAHEITMRFIEPVAARTLVLRNINRSGVIPAELEVSNNGRDFREVASFTINWSFETPLRETITVAFPEVVGKFFRVTFKATQVARPSVSLGELELSTKPAVHYWEAKSGWARVREHGGEAPFFSRDPGPNPKQLNLPASGVVPLNEVHVLRHKLADNGHIVWDVPEGDWTLLRVGYTSLGRTNHPSTREGCGLEVDKLDAESVRFHMEQFIGKLTERYGKKHLGSFNLFETDSWECGAQTWTKGLDLRFTASTGQSLLSWLPLLTQGVVIESYDASDRFLWSWRRFLADEIAKNYFQVVADFAKDNGLTYVAEASGRQMFMYDPIGYQRVSPVPMGEFWMGQGVRPDNKVAASAAHLTGRKFVASESYTSNAKNSRWTNHPFTYKPLGDKAFCAGVNKFVFHTYAQQPYPKLKPGFTMARWGMQNNNGNTWWGKPVEAWMSYISRCQYLLQAGRFYADILAYLGEEVPARLGWRNEFKPSIPSGYDYDGCDFKALQDIRVENGALVLPNGMRYKVLLLPSKKRMRLAVAERIAELVRAGATVISPQIPEGSPSLAEMGKGDRKVRALARKYWYDGPIPPRHNGIPEKVLPAGDDLGKLLDDLGLPPDFSYTDNGENANILYIHRVIGDVDVYFLSNQTEKNITFEASFRQPATRGLTLWDPDTGRKTANSVRKGAVDGVVAATISLDPYGSVFAVFSDKDFEVSPLYKTVRTVPVEGTWQLSFPSGLGAPEKPIQLDRLTDWTMYPDFGVKHFSGTGIYRKTLEIPADYLANGRRCLLDLGDVEIAADVYVNGKETAVLWKPPFRTDITDYLQTGENQLEIRVTNLWPNRLIGDEYFPPDMKWKKLGDTQIVAQWPDWLKTGQPRPKTQRIAWSTRKAYSKNDPLLPSGLIGPVRLHIAE